eukprot:TRINITY_DN4132_c0_g1_i4.p1 TRINITY_DN4132_c0_g1~~TRINITY_DN4132_c0_g1_i4.p1  ORF type:complete len:942 (+),score=185.28 TRINITY_DN4132_c0_g1_i4:184-3009(+)
MSSGEPVIVDQEDEEMCVNRSSPGVCAYGQQEQRGAAPKCLLLMQFRAVFLKNVTLITRQTKQLLLQILLPLVVMLVLGGLSLKYGKKESADSEEFYMYIHTLDYQGGSMKYYDEFFYVDDSGKVGSCVNASFDVDHTPATCGNTLYTGGLLGTFYQVPINSRISCTQYDQPDYWNLPPVNATIVGCSPFFVQYTDWEDALKGWESAFREGSESYNDDDDDVTQCESVDYWKNVPVAGFHFKEFEPDKLKLHYSIAPSKSDLTVSRNYYDSEELVHSMNYMHGAWLRLMENFTYKPNMFAEVNSLELVPYFQNFPEHPEVDGSRSFMIIAEAWVLPFLLQCLLPFFIQKVVVERQSGLSEMLNMSGLNVYMYWAANFCCDCIVYLVYLSVIIIPVGAALGMKFFTMGGAWFYMVLYGWMIPVISLAYVLGAILRTPAQSAIFGYLLVCIQWAAAVNLSFWVFYGNQHAPAYFMFYPPFALCWMFFSVGHAIVSDVIEALPMSVANHESMLAFFWEVGMGLVFLILACYLDQVMPKNIGQRQPVYFPLKWLYRKLKSGLCKRNQYKPVPVVKIDAATDSHEDEDVARERVTVSEIPIGDPAAPLVIRDMCKVFRGGIGSSNVYALDKVSFHANAGECFGLLGPNGAGKTTLVNILCGLMPHSGGDASVGGYSITDDISKVQRIIGLCPQFDMLFEDLTVREHMLFYTRIKGYPIRKEVAHVEAIIKEVSLENERRRIVRNLSGGQRRRLSFAIALTSNPAVVFLDEPTSGLDPGCTREMWAVIQAARQSRCFLLTTHSMAEAETVCTSIGILSKGQLRCIGTPQHLKSRFGQGYKLEVVCDPSPTLAPEAAAAPPPSPVNLAMVFVQSLVPASKMIHCSGNAMAFQIPHDTRLSEIFERLEFESRHHGIKSWSVGQSNLEEVFIHIIKSDEADTDSPPPDKV